MPRIIRKALYLKLRDLPEMREFQRDFELFSGMRLDFVDTLGLSEGTGPDLPPMCAVVQKSRAGCTMCARTRQALLERAGDHPATTRCDAGLNECAIPLNISGIRAGYFLFYGYASARPEQAALQKARHLLGRCGVDLEIAEIAGFLSGSPVVGNDVTAAYQRVAQLAVKQIALKVTDQLVEAEDVMPPAVTKACGFIRARALADELSLAVVARHCAVSEGHLSRIFHRSTGLTFREYLTQVRVDHAKALLMTTGKSVAEIAFESGFQSLSQFHRAFLKAYGQSPGRLRASRRQQSGDLKT